MYSFTLECGKSVHLQFLSVTRSRECYAMHLHAQNTVEWRYFALTFYLRNPFLLRPPVFITFLATHCQIGDVAISNICLRKRSLPSSTTCWVSTTFGLLWGESHPPGPDIKGEFFATSDFWHQRSIRETYEAAIWDCLVASTIYRSKRTENKDHALDENWMRRIWNHNK